jgi:hypothetical protein
MKKAALKGIKNARYLDIQFVDYSGECRNIKELRLEDIAAVRYYTNRRTARKPVSLDSAAGRYWYSTIECLWPGMFGAWVWEINFRPDRFVEVLAFARQLDVEQLLLVEELRIRNRLDMQNKTKD